MEKQPKHLTPSAAALRSWMDDGGRKSQWLADQLSVDPATLSLWLNGHRVPRRDYRRDLDALTEGAVPEATWQPWPDHPEARK